MKLFQFTHLQHAPFEYQIDVTNETSTMKQGTCRIFLLPKVDERGQAMRFRDQRMFAIEMDKFLVHCKYNNVRWNSFKLDILFEMSSFTTNEQQ